MTLEEFIMEVWLSALIGAIAAILVAVIGYVGLVKKDYSSLKESFLDKFYKLTMNNNKLSDEHSDMQKQQDEIKQAVTFLRDNVLIEQGKKENLSQEMIDIKHMSDHISALVDLVHNTQIENVQLKQKYQVLDEENKILRQQLRQYELQFNQEDELEP